MPILIPTPCKRGLPTLRLTNVLMNVARDLFRRLYERRMLIRLIGVKLGGLIGGVQQLDSFYDNDKMIKLYLSIIPVDG